MKMCCFSAS